MGGIHLCVLREVVVTTHILHNTGTRSINTVSIWVWLLSGDRALVLAAARMLRLSGNNVRADRLLSEARDWGII